MAHKRSTAVENTARWLFDAAVDVSRGQNPVVGLGKLARRLREQSQVFAAGLARARENHPEYVVAISKIADDLMLNRLTQSAPMAQPPVGPPRPRTVRVADLLKKGRVVFPGTARMTPRSDVRILARGK